VAIRRKAKGTVVLKKNEPKLLFFPTKGELRDEGGIRHRTAKDVGWGGANIRRINASPQVKVHSQTGRPSGVEGGDAGIASAPTSRAPRFWTKAGGTERMDQSERRSKSRMVT